KTINQCESLVVFFPQRPNRYAIHGVCRRLGSGVTGRYDMLGTDESDIDSKMMATELNHPRRSRRRLTENCNVKLSPSKERGRILPGSERPRHLLIENFVTVHYVNYFLVTRRAQGRRDKLERCLLLSRRHDAQSDTVTWGCYPCRKVVPLGSCILI